MFNSLAVIALFSFYLAILFLIARLAQTKTGTMKFLTDNPYIYTLTLTVYCTTWTYYGSVGKAVASGPLFLSIYLGPTIAAALWAVILKKMVRLRNAWHFTSVADFISTRYGKSQLIGAFLTVAIVLTIIPYIALQLKAIYFSSLLITPSGGDPGTHTNWIILGMLLLFTIVFGARKLDTTKRHEGMMAAVAVESLVKLIAFLAVGLYITFHLFGGFGDIASRFAEYRLANPIQYVPGVNMRQIVLWNVYLLLAMSAFMFLPRQFHVGVVENPSEKHINTAVWLFPLYMLLINIFVPSIAKAGLLMGLPAGNADRFVLLLPQLHGDHWMVALVLIGGFSAATGMVMVCSMALSTMINNHIILPLTDMLGWLQFLRKHLLRVKWAVIAGILLLGHGMETLIGKTYSLVDIGMISFAGILQLAPAAIGGLFWRRGSRIGAISGISAGIFVWAYTLLLPAVLKSIDPSFPLLVAGPWGLEFLRPEALFGFEMVDPLVHAVYWSLLANFGLYVSCSLLWGNTAEEQRVADQFVDFGIQMTTTLSRTGPTVPLIDKFKLIQKMFAEYFPPVEANRLAEQCVVAAGIAGRGTITVLELSGLCHEVEKRLAGSIGTTFAHRTVQDAGIMTREESAKLSVAYAEILAGLMVSPEELHRKVDYYRERESLLARNAAELEQKVTELEIQIAERKKAESALHASRMSFKGIVENSTDAVVIADTEANVRFVNNTARAFFSHLGKDLLDLPSAFDVSCLMGQELAEIEITRPGGDSGVGEMKVTRTEWDELPAYLVLIRDVTERKLAETEKGKLHAQVLQAGKLAAVGQLAGGIAHEINNPIGVILGFSQSVMLEVDKDHPLYLPLSSIEREASRCKRLVGDLLTFSRVGKTQSERTDLNQIIEETLSLIAAKTRVQNIELVKNYSLSLPPLLVNRNQIQQVVMNISSNAIDAMPRGGRLTVTTAADPGFTRIIISDTGGGMPDEVKQHIFEPFFTTKDIGKGTGLGLSLCYEIVHKHQGTIEVESAQGKGTTFTVSLPILQAGA